MALSHPCFVPVRKIAELQAALSDSTQIISKLSEESEVRREEGQRGLETVIAKHQEDMQSFQERLNEAVSMPGTDWGGGEGAGGRGLSNNWIVLSLYTNQQE